MFTILHTTYRFACGEVSLERTKLKKSYAADCLKIWQFHFRLSIMIQTPRSNPNLAKKNRNIYLEISQQQHLKSFYFHFWPKRNMQNNPRKIFKFNTLSVLFLFIFMLGKGFEVLKNTKILRFRWEWDKLWANIWF